MTTFETLADYAEQIGTRKHLRYVPTQDQYAALLRDYANWNSNSPPVRQGLPVHQIVLCLIVVRPLAVIPR